MNEIKIECSIYSRVCGFYTDVNGWNKGKKEEYSERKEYIINEK